MIQALWHFKNRLSVGSAYTVAEIKAACNMLTVIRVDDIRETIMNFTKEDTEEVGTSSSFGRDAIRRPCAGFQKLKEWQIAQFRQAVDEDKWYMSEKEGHEVRWEVAEHDFVEHGCYGLALHWREEYCSHICEYSGSCLLAARFLSEALASH